MGLFLGSQHIRGTAVWSGDVLDTMDANATAADILFEKTAYVGGVKLIGSIPNNADTIVSGTWSNINSNTVVDISIPLGYYNTGSTIEITEAALLPDNIKTGTTIFNVGGTFTADADAVATNLLTGKTAYVNGAKVTGSMVNRSASGWLEVPWANSNQNAGVDVFLDEGYYDGETGVFIKDDDLAPSNIKTGINIFNVVGTFTSDANAVAANILATKTAYVNGSLVTGTMINRTTNDHAALQASGGYTPNRIYMLPPTGYYEHDAVNDTSWVYADDTDYIAANIKTGVDIFGLVGTYTSDANAVVANILATKTAYVNGAKLTGTMTNRSTGDYAADSSSVSGTTLKLSIPGDAFYGNAANITITDADFLASNIKTGINIFGITGTFGGVNTSDATAVAADIRVGKTAYVNEVKITGTIPTAPAYPSNWTAVEFHVYQNKASANGNHSAFMRPPAGYYDGSTWVGIDAPTLTPANVAKGVVIGGAASITGTHERGYRWTTPGVYSFTMPTGCTTVAVFIRGAQGGGKGGQGGGGITITSNPCGGAPTVTYTTGGDGGNGNPGGASSFGEYRTANGGAGASAYGTPSGTTGVGGAGGTAASFSGYTSTAGSSGANGTSASTSYGTHSIPAGTTFDVTVGDGGTGGSGGAGGAVLVDGVPQGSGGTGGAGTKGYNGLVWVIAY